MSEKILHQLRCWEFKKYKVKIIPRHKKELILKAKLLKIFEENNIDIEDEYMWDLAECALYCWTFCHDIDLLLFIVSFWIQTIMLDDAVYKNDEG